MTREHDFTTTDAWQELQQQSSELQRVRAINAELERSVNTAQSSVEIYKMQLGGFAQALVEHAPKPCVAAPVPLKVN